MSTIAVTSAGPSPQTRLPLTMALRQATAELHRQAERAGIMPNLLRGRLARGQYCALLRNLHALYGSLEVNLARHAADRAIGRISLPVLARRAALANDLGSLHGARWEQEIPLTSAIIRYVERLDDLARADPRMLIAHAYVRYLGDLSGGQIIRCVIGSALGLAAETGLSFYRFSEAPEVLAKRLRSELDSIALTSAEQTRLLEEARLAFRRHIELFEQLGG